MNKIQDLIIFYGARLTLNVPYVKLKGANPSENVNQVYTFIWMRGFPQEEVKPEYTFTLKQ